MSISEQVAALLDADRAAHDNDCRSVADPFLGLTQAMVDGMDDTASICDEFKRMGWGNTASAELAEIHVSLQAGAL
jgi:hypothetical protein